MTAKHTWLMAPVSTGIGLAIALDGARTTTVYSTNEWRPDRLLAALDTHFAVKFILECEGFALTSEAAAIIAGNAAAFRLAPTRMVLVTPYPPPLTLGQLDLAGFHAFRIQQYQPPEQAARGFA